LRSGGVLTAVGDDEIELFNIPRIQDDQAAGDVEVANNTVCIDICSHCSFSTFNIHYI